MLVSEIPFEGLHLYIEALLLDTLNGIWEKELEINESP
jgi:hypothetical protein